MHGDLTPDRRIHATGGQARNLYAELARNLATRTNPEGAGLASMVERFIGQAQQEARAADGNVEDVIHQHLDKLSELVGGYDSPRWSRHTGAVTIRVTRA